MNATDSGDECNFLLSEEEAIYSLYTQFEKIFILVVVPLVLAFGLVGNITFIFVVYRLQTMRTVTNFILCNLAISDSLLLTITSVKYVVSYFNAPISYGNSYSTGFRCAFNMYLTYMFYYTSTFLVTLVTFERYFAICHPVKHLAMKGKGLSEKLVFASWFISSAMACLCLFRHRVEYVCVEWSEEWDYSDLATKYPVCTVPVGWHWVLKAIDSVDFTQFCFTVLSSIYMYCRIIYSLCAGSQRQTSMTQARQQIAKMLILTGTVFFLLLTPYQLVIIDTFFYGIGHPIFTTTDQLTYVLWIGRVTTQLNAAINPVLYTVSNPGYRKAFMKAFRCRASKLQDDLKSSKFDTNITLQPIV